MCYNLQKRGGLRVCWHSHAERYRTDNSIVTKIPGKIGFISFLYAYVFIIIIIQTEIPTLIVKKSVGKSFFVSKWCGKKCGKHLFWCKLGVCYEKVNFWFGLLIFDTIKL